MTRLIVFFLLILVLYSLLRFLFKGRALSRKKRNSKNEPEDLVQDPYCKTYIPRGSALRKKVGGQMLHFCCDRCLKSYTRAETKNNA